MLKRLSIFTVLATLAATGAGCTCCHMGHRPLRPGVVCDPTHCPGTCGPALGAQRQVACGVAECDPCDPCGPCYYGEYSPFGPLAAVFRIFRPITWMGPSCGERYWGGYLSDPPDCCDPCDSYGNYTGMHVRNHLRGAGHCATCVDHGCQTGCTDGGYSAAGPEYLGMRHPTTPVPRQPAYLGQQSQHIRSPAGTGMPGPDPSSRYAPRVISVEDRVVGEPRLQPTAAARSLEAVRR